MLDRYADREELGELERTGSAAFNPDRRTLLEARERLEADVTGDADPVARNEEEKGISLPELERVLVAASDATTEQWGRLRERWFEKLLGPERDAVPTNAHVHYLRRLSPLESTYTKDRAVEICLATTLALGFDMTAIPNIRLERRQPAQVVHVRVRGNRVAFRAEELLEPAFAEAPPLLRRHRRTRRDEHALEFRQRRCPSPLRSGHGVGIACHVRLKSARVPRGGCGAIGVEGGQEARCARARRAPAVCVPVEHRESPPAQSAWHSRRRNVTRAPRITFSSASSRSASSAEWPFFAPSSQPVETLALVATRVFRGEERVDVRPGEEIAVARDDHGLLRKLLLADADRAGLLGSLEVVLLEPRLVLGGVANGCCASASAYRSGS